MSFFCLHFMLKKQHKPTNQTNKQTDKQTMSQSVQSLMFSVNPIEALSIRLQALILYFFLEWFTIGPKYTYTNILLRLFSKSLALTNEIKPRFCANSK